MNRQHTLPVLRFFWSTKKSMSEQSREDLCCMAEGLASGLHRAKKQSRWQCVGLLCTCVCLSASYVSVLVPLWVCATWLLGWFLGVRMSAVIHLSSQAMSKEKVTACTDWMMAIGCFAFESIQFAYEATTGFLHFPLFTLYSVTLTCKRVWHKVKYSNGFHNL